MRVQLIIYRSYCTRIQVSYNCQISRYAKLGQIENARKVFDQMPDRSTVSWNSMVAGYFQNNQPVEARKLFDMMQERNLVSWNGLISGYIKNGMVSEARKVFDSMPERNVVSWTSMVKGYVQEGKVSEAESLFWKMPGKNVVSWTVMLGGLIQDGRIDEARRLYDMMPEKDVVARTNMIGGYFQVGRLDEAREIFDEMPQRNDVSWTMMISGYVHNQRVDIARKLFEVMPEKSEVSWTAMLTGYTQCGRIKEASELFEAMPVKSAVACNAIIHGYGQNGEVVLARQVFDSMRERDDQTWSAMIKVYERKGFELEALNLFTLMQRDGVRPNFSSLISLLSVCGRLATLDHGRRIHAQLVTNQFDHDVYVASALITMYVRCGDLLKAKLVFEGFGEKDIVMWNSIITGYAQHDLVDEALQIFQDMCSSGIAPDDITFIGVLSACSYSGKVEQGLEIFKTMKTKYQVKPRTPHYACMVDLLGRAGQVKEATDLIEKMPVETDAIVWGALLSACRSHNKLDLAEVAAKKLIQLEPNNAGPYVLLSNIYASKGRWDEIAELRKIKRTKSVTKSPDCSWMEVDNKMHIFTLGDHMGHPEHVMITKMLERLGVLLREAGYCPDSNFVLHDVGGEEKVQSLGYHRDAHSGDEESSSLRKLPSNNKLISEVTGREINVRVANIFHHFKEALHSCRDCW